ncbi:hypothetical protein BG006_002789, partial [Podila minutissima]
MAEPVKRATHITYGATPQSPPVATTTTDFQSSYDTHDHDTTDEDDDGDEIEALDAAKGATSTWRSWCRSLLKFFRGLGKFFLILALGTIILVLVLQYTLPRVD